MTFSAVVIKSLKPQTEKAGLKLSHGSDSYYGHSRSLKLIAVDFLFTTVLLSVPAINKITKLDYSDPDLLDKLGAELTTCMAL